MKINEFCTNFKNKRFITTPQGAEEMVTYLKKELEVKEYLPFADKRELCEKVLDTCNTRGNDGLIKIDSVSRYIIFTVAIISKYTNLEFSSGEDEEYDSLDEYDMLCQNHLLNPILGVIGEEYDVCNNLLNMMMEDIIANNNTVEAVLGYAFGKVTDSLDGLIDTFAEKVEEMELDLSQIDFDKYKGLLDLLPKK